MTERSAFVALRATAKRLIPRRFEPDLLHKTVNSFALQHGHAEVYGKRFHWRTFRSAVPYLPRAESVRFQKESQMAWKAPKIVEVPVGMEINMYACAARK
jgi:coenzyme PQQ precursor peptide PqqA